MFETNNGGRRKGKLNEMKRKRLKDPGGDPKLCGFNDGVLRVVS
jgi:hypothetical protein